MENPNKPMQDRFCQCLKASLPVHWIALKRDESVPSGGRPAEMHLPDWSYGEAIDVEEEKRQHWICEL